MATTKKKAPKKGTPSKRWVPPPPKKKATTRHQPPKKVSHTMTTEKEQRGAGSGEEAVRYREQKNPTTGQHPSQGQPGKPKDDDDKEDDKSGKTRKSKDGDSDDPQAEGDPEKGKIDPDDPDRYIAMKDRRAYLIDQAEKNEKANDELNAIQVAQNERYRKAMLENNPYIDPDKQRDESMESARAQLMMHDPDTVKKNAEAAKKARAEAGTRQFGSPNTPDFRAGQVSG